MRRVPEGLFLILQLAIAGAGGIFFAVLMIFLFVTGILFSKDRVDTRVNGERFRFEYFHPLSEFDPWSLKVTDWQLRVRIHGAVLPPVSLSPNALDIMNGENSLTTLREEYEIFLFDRSTRAAPKLVSAISFVMWYKIQGKRFYKADSASYDHWPTFAEVLAKNGDDCDGLATLAYHMLRQMGFSQEEVFLALMYSPQAPIKSRYHMALLWFDRKNDPRVIDYGSIASGMNRVSELEGWFPLVIFNDEARFAVRILPAS